MPFRHLTMSEPRSRRPAVVDASLVVRHAAPMVALAAALLFPAAARAQAPAADSVRGTRRDTSVTRLEAVRVTGAPVFPTAALDAVTGTAVYAGKKSERIDLSLVDGNLATNSMRQVFGRSPGIFVFELDGAGIQDGIAARGLSPNRSWEFNTRQDGVDITPDPFGYPEAYYTPAFESLERVEVVRGASSLQYGPQFGGLLNYVTKRGPLDRPVAVEVTQRAGANGLYAGYAGVGGTVNGINYYGYANFRRGDGWRDDNDYTSRALHFGATAPVAPRGRLGFAVTYSDNEIRQPGGLTEAQFAADAQSSFRRRDWFGTPWLIPMVTYEQALGQRTFFTAKAFGLVAERTSLGLSTASTIVDTLLNPRRMNEDRYRNAGTELRLVHNFAVAGRPSAVAGGVRASVGHTSRMIGLGPGGEGFDARFVAPKTSDLTFTTGNLAAFAESKVALTDRISVVPGVRLEHLRASGAGESYAANAGFERADTVQRMRDRRASETVPLLGLGVTYTALGGEVYGNVAQAYRPVTFSDQFPNDLVDVSPDLHSARGVSTDVGVRGTVGRLLTYDVSGFYLVYGDRVGTLGPSALGADSLLHPYGLRANLGESRHYGLESFAELDATRLVGGDALARQIGSMLLFTSAGRTVARYTEGAQAGRQVEYSPDWIVRGGVTYRLRDRLSATVQGSSVGASYSNANNSPHDPAGNGQQGLVPAYTVWDLSGGVRVWHDVRFEASVNNLFDRRYYTRRTSTGISPADGRTVTAGLRLDFAAGGR
jgi:Fe(3+) dicitrate transport protein